MTTYTGHVVLRSVLPLAFLALLAPWAQPAGAQASTAPVDRTVQREIVARAGDLQLFYAERAGRPLWLDDGGHPSQAASILIEQLRTAQFDGVDPQRLKLERLAKLVDKARTGEAGDRAAAEVELSRTFAAYARAMRSVTREPMIYENPALEPAAPTVLAALRAAAEAPSLSDYLTRMGWMHPLYGPLRQAMIDERYSVVQRRQIWKNLARVRALPAMTGRYVLVDADGARLWMYDNGRPIDTMKVVVGKPDLPTPMMAGYIRRAIVDPYWEIPVDLVQKNIAPNVVKEGVRYLARNRYQVLADFTADAAVLDPRTVDWRAVRDGRLEIHVRQLPGGENFMGKVKFEFPNPQGIYLHDTPAKNLMKLDARQQSSGCVRLEDADRLGRWLMNGPLPKSTTPETAVPLPQVVPVYITYLTAMPGFNGEIAFRGDPYGRDGIEFASAQNLSGRADRP